MHAAQRAITKGPKPAKEGWCQELLAPSVVQAHSNSFQSILHQSLAYPRAKQGARLRPEKGCHFVAYRSRESNTKIVGRHLTVCGSMMQHIGPAYHKEQGPKTMHANR